MIEIKKNIKSYSKITAGGFSLVELIIVITFLAIFASVGLTRTKLGVDKIRTQVAIDQITSDIDILRSMAFAKHDTLTMVFSLLSDSYTIYTGPNGGRSILTNFPNSTHGVVSFRNSNFSEVDIISANFGGSSELQFLPLGDLKTGGSISINSNTITIKDLTGKWIVN